MKLRRLHLLIILIIALLAFSTRLLPLSISSLPYNNDGMFEARVSEILVTEGFLAGADSESNIVSYGLITPFYNILLAFSSDVIGSSPFEIAQIVVATISILTVAAAYVIAISMIGCRKAALTAALTVGLFGTFVFLTGSAWKESLGVALLLLLIYSYMNRYERRMLVLEIVILAFLPFVHHLVTAVACLTIAYLTSWVVIFAAVNKRLARRHLIDVIVISVLGAFAYAYYAMRSFGRIVFVTSDYNMMIWIGVFVLLLTTCSWIIMRKYTMKHSLAPVVASVVFCLFMVNQYYPLFPYSWGAVDWIIMLALTFSVLLGIAWFGIESELARASMYRTIPLALFLPVATFVMFGLFDGTGLEGHKMIYRTYDFIDISLALGVAAAVYSLAKRPVRQNAVVLVIIAVLLISFPFAYYSQTLIGPRHDTQEYEVDALDWVVVHGGSSLAVQSDERISYLARALHDMPKNSLLPSILAEEDTPKQGVFNLFLTEWCSVGVSDYPRGYYVISPEFYQSMVTLSNVVYVGGPTDNQIVAFVVI